MSGKRRKTQKSEGGHATVLAESGVACGNQPQAKRALGLRKGAWPWGQLTLDFWPLES